MRSPAYTARIPAESKALRFDGFEVDLAAGRLLRRGLRIHLRDQSFQVLAALLEHPGRVVTREELRRRLWPEEVFVDFDNNLNTAVARLREALGDSAEHPRFIETLPKHGYRFLANVAEAPAPPQPAARARLVVLPFLNLSGNPAQEYFSDAMTDEIITELASLAPEQLAVIARTTAMHYKGSHKDVARIGRELGVDYLVEGGVNRAGDQIVVNVQLIRSNDQAHLWAHRYVAEMTDIFKVYDLAARTIASHVGVAPALAKDGRAETPRRRPTENLAAYNEYVQGRYYFANLSPQALARGIEHFEEAIRRDPNLALAHDSLAEMYWHMAFYGFMAPQQAFSTGVRHALRALEIDNTLAETHSLLALYHKLDYNWPEAEREMALARTLEPTSGIIRTRYAINVLVPQGRLEEAAAELEAALDLDPLSIYARTLYALVFDFWRLYDRAIEEARRLLEIDPNAYWGYLAIGSANRELRRYDDAIAAYRKAVELSGGSAAMLGWLGMTLGLSGNKVEARALLKRLHEMAKQSYVPPTSFAWIHLGLGENDSTFEWLDRAVDARDQLAAAIKTYPFLDPIRSDPRYAALVRKMRLEP